ncbi:MAG TPA: methylated-DNA--[protein]-cysteine S-methyltransferase [Methylibium sp.]|nr:methylated-DNA--[protein]-cysteine S-methyltransferase [Methylibium sp.]
MNAIPFAAQARTDTPLGPVTLAATERGLAGLWFDGQKHHPGAIDAPTDATQRWLVQALAELARYWGDARRPFTVPLDPQGSAFQRAVWQALRGIDAGRTVSYGELAERLGRGDAVRAVAAAIGRNPLSIVVPCHRVLGRDGSLTGYAGGLERKSALLTREAAREAARV